MGEPIRRKTLAAIAREYERDGRVAPWQPDAPKEFNPGAVFFGVNGDATPIMPGDKLVCTDFAVWNIGYEAAYRQVIKNKIKFFVQHWDDENNVENPDQPILIRALTPASHNHICQFIVIPGNYYLANVYFPNGTLTSYVMNNGVGTNTKDDAFAYVEFSSQLSAADQSGGKYGVALCAKIETGVTAQDVISEITSQDILRKLGASRKSQSVVTEVNFNIDSNGYLEIIPTFTTIRYIGWEL